MTDTVDALGYKADVKARAGDYVGDKKQALSDRAHGVAEAADSMVSRVTGAVPDPRAAKQSATQGARRAGGIAQSNPLGVAIGGIAAGFLVGLMLPSTRMEDERMGDVADQVKERVVETGQEAIEHGKQVAQETAQVAMQGARDAAQSAVETARDSGQEHAEELKDTAREQAQSLPGVGGQQGGGMSQAGMPADTSGVGVVEESGPVGGPVHLRNDPL